MNSTELRMRTETTLKWSIGSLVGLVLITSINPVLLAILSFGAYGWFLSRQEGERETIIRYRVVPIARIYLILIGIVATVISPLYPTYGLIVLGAVIYNYRYLTQMYYS